MHIKKTVKKQNKNKKKHVFFDFIWFLPCFFNWPHCGKKQHTVSTVQVENISNDYRMISEWLPKDYGNIILLLFRPFGLQIDDSCGFVIKITLRHEEIIALWSILSVSFFLFVPSESFVLHLLSAIFFNKMNDFLSFLRLFLPSSFDRICVALYLCESA